MRRMPAARRPQFAAGDRVVVVSPSAPVPRGSVGVVSEVLVTEVDPILRYHVLMENGRVMTCFGFELAFAADAAAS